jgi:hypothetical protein
VGTDNFAYDEETETDIAQTSAGITSRHGLEKVRNELGRDWGALVVNMETHLSPVPDYSQRLR